MMNFQGVSVVSHQFNGNSPRNFVTCQHWFRLFYLLLLIVGPPGSSSVQKETGTRRSWSLIVPLSWTVSWRVLGSLSAIDAALINLGLRFLSGQVLGSWLQSSGPQTDLKPPDDLHSCGVADALIASWPLTHGSITLFLSHVLSLFSQLQWWVSSL